MNNSEKKTVKLNRYVHKGNNGKTLEENMDAYYYHMRRIEELKAKSRELGERMVAEQKRVAEQNREKMWRKVELQDAPKPQDRPMLVVRSDIEREAVKRCEHLVNKYTALKEAVFEVRGERVYNQVLQKADSIDFGRGADFARMMRK